MLYGITHINTEICKFPSFLSPQFLPECGSLVVKTNTQDSDKVLIQHDTADRTTAQGDHGISVGVQPFFPPVSTVFTALTFSLYDFRDEFML